MGRASHEQGLPGNAPVAVCAGSETWFQQPRNGAWVVINMGNMSAGEWSEFSALLDEALDLPDAEREAWLQRLAQAKPGLVARVAKALALRGKADFGHFLSEPSALLADQLAASSLVGSRIGPWVIEAEVGRGGMGSVWRARRADGRFEGIAAIKFLHLALMGRDGERRFRTEGSALGRLDHPNIVRLLDAGVFDGNQPYLVLEHIAGEPIDVYCDRRDLDLEARVRLFADVLSAVAHAHSQLVVHRDLKPSNILVTPDGSVKLFDFGIAMLMDINGGAPPTQSGHAAMTPLYAAPEQLLGQPTSAATDIYSLGVVLYQLLTGAHPVKACTQSMADVTHAVITVDPPAPSASAQLRSIRPKLLQGDLDNIISRALKKDPRERYESVTAFADDIRRYLSHQPVYARPDTLRYRTGKFVRRNRGSVVVASLTLVALVLSAVFSFWQMRVARQQRDTALAAARRADAVGDFMTLMVGDIGSLAGAQTLRSGLDHAHALVTQQKVDDPVVKANLLRYIAGRYTELGDPGTAVTILDEARAAMKSVDEPIATAQLDCSIANLDDDLDRQDAADEHIHEAIALLDAAGAAVRPQVRADCRLIESYLDTDRGRNQRAVAAAGQAVSDLEHAGIRVGLQHDTAINALARAHAHAGQNGAAVKLLRELRAGDALQGRDRTVGGWIHGYNEARDLLAGGRVVEALALATTLQQQSRQFGADEGDARDIAVLRAGALLAASQPDEAAAVLDPLAGGGLEVALLRMELALQRHDAGAAARAYEVDKAAIDAAMRARKPEGAEAMRVRARLQMAARQHDGAEATLAQAAALAVDAEGNPTPELRLVAALRADNDLQRGQWQPACDRAVLAGQRARAEAVDASSSAWIGEALLLEARCREATGGLGPARELAQRAAQHLAPNLGVDHPLSVEARTLASR